MSKFTPRRKPSPPRRRPWWAAGPAIALIAAALFYSLRGRPSLPAVPRDGAPVWSPDGSRLAFYSERDGNSEIYVMNADGASPRRLTVTRASEGYPAWSPDGRTLTFDTDRDGNFEIYTMAADGSNPRRLTTHPSRDLAASWSPDGRSIAFMSDRAGQFDVYVMDSGGSAGRDAGATGGDAGNAAAARRLTTAGTNWFPMWSPDGARLTFHVLRDVHVVNGDGSGYRRLTTDPANGMYPSWSPDGTSIAFMSWRNGRTEIFTMNDDGSNQTRVVSMPQGDAIDPRWSPDGSTLVFVHLPGGMEGAERAIYTIRRDGTGLTRLSR